ncbi:MAG TPA: hypothetical protein VG052_00210 [Puia sp.]|jgi:hypothetical protein|nr:hypothetical protein [Puia sp.]
MKNHLHLRYAIFPLLILVTVNAFSQVQVSWGDEFKMHKGSTDLAILSADKSGIYMEESHAALGTYFVIGYTVRKSATLVKLDPSLKEQYRNDFDHELKGKQFDRLFVIRDKLYLFATDYSKKEKTLYLYAAEIDKSTGSLKGGWQQVYTWQKDDKSEQIDFTVSSNADSSKIVLTGTYTGSSQNRYEIKTMDLNLQPSGKTFNVTNEFDPKTFQVEDFVYTPTGNAILVGRVYEYEEGKSKKDKNLLFKNYNIRIYDAQGKMKKELATDINGKFLVTGKMMQVKNEYVLAAFYSNDKKKKEINGLLVQRIDPATGNILVSTQKELNNSLITEVEEDDDNSSKKSKDKNDEEGLAANLKFRNIFVTPDNGLVILAESYTRRVVESSSYMNTGQGGGQWNSNRYVVYECGNIYMSKISVTGNIDWIHVLPKSQRETIQTGTSNNSMFTYQTAGESFFEANSNMPFYAGFNCLDGKSMINIFFNDNEKNADILQEGKKIKRVTSFGKSQCYVVALDPVSGKYTRKSLFSNKDIPTSMPRLGVVLNNTMYLMGKEDRVFGKTKIVVGRLTCND